MTELAPLTADAPSWSATTVMISVTEGNSRWMQGRRVLQLQLVGHDSVRYVSVRAQWDYCRSATTVCSVNEHGVVQILNTTCRLAVMGPSGHSARLPKGVFIELNCIAHEAAYTAGENVKRKWVRAICQGYWTDL